MEGRMYKEHNYYVYIMASISKVLYIGVTNDIIRRVYEHKSGKIKGFTSKYRCYKLVYFEYFTQIEEAIQREKQLKRWKREKKITFIEKENSQWRDLYSNVVGVERE